MTSHHHISAGLEGVRARIAQACRRAGREPREVTLLAVSKTQTPGSVRAAWQAGQRAFGENYAQELCAKSAELTDLDGVEWHYIGRLQSNKSQMVAPLVRCVHSIDSVKLARELGRRANDSGRVIEALVQVNLGAAPIGAPIGHQGRAGCQERELDAVLDAIEREGALSLRGLMAVPPPTEDPGEARTFFEALVALRDSRGGAARLPVLSFGMSHDLEVAIECGATIVRVGSAIFGPRAP